MNPASGRAVLLMAFGAPENPEEVRPFLREVLRGRSVPEDRIEEAARRYEEIGGVSPLLQTVRRQAQALARELARRGLSAPVHVGMCHWRPFIREALEEMAAAGIRRVAGIVLAPQGVETALKRYRGAVMAGLAHLGSRAPQVVFGPNWYDGPFFIDALAGRVREALSAFSMEVRSHSMWMFSAHSISAASPDSGLYLQQLRRTGDLLAGRFGSHAWELVFQSAAGSGRNKWLQPDINDAIKRAADRGERAILTVPIGFACENVELIFDLDREASRTAADAGLAFIRARAVGEHEAFTAQLAEAALEALGET